MTASYIIPVYNGEKTIITTINKITDMMTEDSEIIVINDGSSDNTETIIIDYIKNNPGVKINYQKQSNSGPGTARNTGISKAQGEFIFFIDADDEPLDVHTKELLAGITDSDFCYGDYLIRNENTQQTTQINCAHSYDRQDASKCLLEFVTFNNHISLWNSVFRREIIRKNNLAFSSRRFSEDVEFISNYLCCCRNVQPIQKTIYIYSYDGNRAFQREKQHIAANSTTSIWQDMIQTLQTKGWTRVTDAIKYSRLPVEAVYYVIQGASDCENFDGFKQFLGKTETRTLIQYMHRVKQNELPGHIYVKTKAASILFRLSSQMFYHCAKCLKKYVYH